MTTRDRLPGGANCHALVMPGTKHHTSITGKQHARTCQDHAVALQSEWATVLAVADGVSLVRRESSHTQFGAVLGAELAAAVALQSADRGEGPSEIRALVLASLGSAFEGLQRRFEGLDQGVRFRRMACSTLLLAVRTASWSAVWCAGDGYFGALGGRESRVVDGDVVRSLADGRWVAHGGRRSRALPSSHILPDCTVETDGRLPLVLQVEGLCDSLWVASDGLEDEWPVAAYLGRTPAPLRYRLIDHALRLPGSDDLAVAAAGSISALSCWLDIDEGAS